MKTDLEQAKIITVQQPWAHLIIHGLLFEPTTSDVDYKDIENRTWPTKYKGPVLIHAGKSRSEMGLLPHFVGLYEDDLVFGAVIGQVEQYGCVKFDEVRDNRWAIGPWCHLYRNPRPFATPITWKGKLGLCDADQELLTKARHELQGATS